MTKVIPDDFHDEDLEEVKDKWYKRPSLFILGVFMALLIVLMVVPYYGVALDPNPVNIPSLQEVVSVIPNGNDGGNETIGEGNIYQYLELVDSNDVVVKQVADRIASSACESGQRVCHAKALFFFVRDEFDYVGDPLAFEYVKSARLSLHSKGGDCDDASILLASLLGAVGIRTRFVFVPGHVYVQAKIPEALSRYQDDGWVNLDGTCSFCDFGEIALPYARAEKRFVG
ncbi:MAG: transglutaminase-like domain-containing protein [Candidatus Woesearchaeota archaeon]|jgi:transglutaminase-like putative cysteine protease|nr:transglutaminase-like domain-containing protein [Candidatus Woesearchaeota archaeon]MDP7324165.1 transglutaminase-like domain-containing protein [Candidatus Woesearchaeota archaeon]MDP7457767.1 transglutaminase-like domain-containing protein [Candidatus Woesearchaeota archaeon]